MALMQNIRPPDALPSDTKKNPKECKAVTLRNGRDLEEVPPKKKNIAEAELIPAKRAKPKQTIAEQPVEKVVHINIPLVELLQEVPKYAKYIKDVVANKRRWAEFETVALIEECSSRLADRSLAYPDGIIEDVLVKVGPFILPVDFVILDYETDKSVPLIMGREFLSTLDVVIQWEDVHDS
ncbi:uncharacterized protein LOC132033715 [Lycium ferocissimum]|uniref:uncharacterized protein LOC132033715 n=1 Tax=Lycium ferocissimum TaxID=112874 RepID=UPI0028155C76|nr:uncharacterized protein LOC132033715 [Lycium ferocissimum]